MRAFIAPEIIVVQLSPSVATFPPADDNNNVENPCPEPGTSHDEAEGDKAELDNVVHSLMCLPRLSATISPPRSYRLPGRIERRRIP